MRDLLVRAISRSLRSVDGGVHPALGHRTEAVTSSDRGRDVTGPINDVIGLSCDVITHFAVVSAARTSTSRSSKATNPPGPPAAARCRPLPPTIVIRFIHTPSPPGPAAKQHPSRGEAPPVLSVAAVCALRQVKTHRSREKNVACAGRGRVSLSDGVTATQTFDQWW